MLVAETENDNSAVASGWVVADVREIRVEGQQNPFLSCSCLEDGQVRVTSQPLFRHVGNVMSFLAEQAGKIGRHILIELELQPDTSVCSGCNSSSRANQAA